MKVRSESPPLVVAWRHLPSITYAQIIGASLLSNPVTDVTEYDQLNEPAFKQTSNFHLRVEGATASVTGTILDTTTNTGILNFNDQRIK